MNKDKRILDHSKAVRGIERREHFARGGSLVAWRGGPSSVTKNKKREQNRKARNYKMED